MRVTTMVGKTGGKNNGIHYAASKAGIISITKGFARAFGGKGIRVNAVAPGIIDTSMSRGVPGSDKQAKESPLGRWGTAAEVGSVIAFLVSEEASYMNGAIVDVNGGVL
jgi:3-oxoacyl-[acyl-carrier protein] reductase